MATRHPRHVTMESAVIVVCFLAVLFACQEGSADADDCGECTLVGMEAFECKKHAHLQSLKTDEVAYVGSQSTITVQVDSSFAKQYPKLFYKFCYVYNVTWTHHSSSGSIGCVENGSYARLDVNWTEAGLATVVVEVRSENGVHITSLLTCGSTNTTVFNAESSDIELVVDAVGSYTSEVEHYLELGNVTFIPNVSASEHSRVYYRYNFGDGSPEIGSSEDRFVHTYVQAGYHAYWVDAIAVVNNSKAYQARYSDYIILQEAITNVRVVVNDGRPVLEGAAVSIDVVVSGSLPIQMCWHTEPQETMMRTNYTVICDTSTNHLWTLEASVSSFQYRFTTVGERSFVAEFANNVSFFRLQFPLTVMKDYCKNAMKDLDSCIDHPNITSFRVDTVAYRGEWSDLVVVADPNVTMEYSSLFYRFCADRPHNSSQVSNFTSGNSTVVLQYQWTNHTAQSSTMDVQFLVQVFPSNTSDVLLGCATSTTTLYSSVQGQLSLDVKLLNDAQTPQFSVANEEHNHYLLVGNITFVCNVSDTDVSINRILYHFKFGDRSPEEEYKHPNVTHLYNRTGNYSYQVEAIAIYDDYEAYHAVYKNYTILAAAVDNINIHISSNNSVTQNADATITISSGGSRPIVVCWRYEMVNGSSPITTSSSWLECLGNYTQTVLNASSSHKVHMSFHGTGDFQFVGTFQNVVSRKSGTFKFKVVPGKSSPVVATVSTAVVVVVVLLIIVVILVVAVAVYIPYRRYKNRMTETANFQFVELNHKTSLWHRAKRRVRQLRDLFHRNRYEKVGLVNLSTDDSNSLYGSNGTHHHTPHEQL